MSIYATGTVSVTAGSASVTGSGTAWQLFLIEGGLFSCQGIAIPIQEVVSDAELTLSYAWTGATGAGLVYAIDRQSAASASAVEANDRLAQIVKRLEALSYVDFDAVGSLADRTAYDEEPKGFKFLDISTDPFELWVKASAASGDWAGPNAYGQGPKGDKGNTGDAATVIVGATTTVAPGQPANVSNSGTSGAAVLDFDIPAGEGFYFQGPYDGGTAYVKDDVVAFMGASYIALQATTGNDPVIGGDTAYWALLAERGDDGDVPEAPIDGISYMRKDNAWVPADVKPHNYIINGNFDVWQRGTSFTGPRAGNVYCADRWAYGDGSDGDATVTRETFAPGQTDVPGNPKHYAFIQQTVAATGGSPNLQQNVEGVETLSGEMVTFTFWARAVAGAPDLIPRLVQRMGSGGSPSADVDIFFDPVTLTTAWQRFSVVIDIPSIAGKTLGTNGDDCLQISLNVSLGDAPDFCVVRASLNRGDWSWHPDPFEERPLGEEWALCKRFYVGNLRFAGAGYASGAGQTARSGAATVLPQEMRAAPSFAYTENGSDNTTDVASGPSTLILLPNSMKVGFASTAAGSQWWDISVDLDAEL